MYVKLAVGKIYMVLKYVSEKANEMITVKKNVWFNSSQLSWELTFWNALKLKRKVNVET